MGIFTRFKDIVSSNLNSMLDKAENPEKLIRMMIREMEETLVELKAACAETMAKRKRVLRELDAVNERAAVWSSRAAMAVEKGRDDLAREALAEKRRVQERMDALEEEAASFNALIDNAHEDIAQLEEKLVSAREKQRLLTERAARAGHRLRAREDMGRAVSMDAVYRFEKLEQRVEHMEAEAEMAAPQTHPDLEARFNALENDEDIERELADLKASVSGKPAAKKETKKAD